MSDCITIKEITTALQDGGDAEELIPYNAEVSYDCYKELLLLYLKYGKNKDRLEICKKKFMEIDI